MLAKLRQWWCGLFSGHSNYRLLFDDSDGGWIGVFCRDCGWRKQRK